MSYTKFKKTEDEFSEIFNVKSKISKVRDYADKNLKLVLCSENIIGTLKPILNEMLGCDLDDKKVVLIPNAGIGTDKMKMSYRYLEQFTTINNMYLKQLDIERWPKKLIVDSLESCDVIAFSGGLVSRLMKLIDASELRDVFEKIIKSGKPIVGFSAGAMCLSETTYFLRNYIGDPDPDIVFIKPFGLVDFEVYPHFFNIMLPSIKTMLPKGKQIEAYAMSDREAMIIMNGELLQAGNPVRIS